MKEKQQLTIGSLERSSGFFREHAVKRVSCAGSNAIVPNSSQYLTTDSSVRISWSAILPYTQIKSATEGKKAPTVI